MTRRLLPFILAGAACALLAAGAALYYRTSVNLPILKHQLAPTVLGWKATVLPWAGGNAPGLADGPVAASRFADPYGLVIDPAGNTYISDAGNNNRIRKIGADGSVSTVAGGKEGFADGPAQLAMFNTPSGLALDQHGNLFVADTANNAIRKISPDGMVSTVAGNGQPGNADGKAGAARFNGPLGVAVDEAGNVYIADTYNDRIRVLGTDGMVRTLAGGDHPGFQDGAAALFDTPCAIALGPRGELYVADVRNNAIRVIGADRQVRTLARSDPEDREALLRRPISLAVAHDGVLYVGDNARGRILQITPAGAVRGLTGVGIDIAIGDAAPLRLHRPAALALAKDGSLLVADASAYAVRKVVPATGAAALAVRPALATAATARPFPWPLKPQQNWHEIVGTMGEVRGNYDGESRDHFHNGLDVQGEMGTPVLAVQGEKVSSPTPNWSYGELGEGMSIESMSYIHMRVGRTVRDAPIDPARFQILMDDKGKPERVRVKRGTRFAVGDTLGTVNRMFHVHLAYTPGGSESNPLALPFGGVRDDMPPRIESIDLFDEQGQPLRKSGKKGAARVLVPRQSKGIAIVVGAYDQMDGNAARRRLGLYKLGYQVLQADGTPLKGEEQPHINVEFNRLPPDSESVKVAYAANSGITVHGSAVTRFLYVVTNQVRDGHARQGFWQPGQLAPGNYIIRITAADFAGNLALAGRDLALTIQ